MYWQCIITCEICTKTIKLLLTAHKFLILYLEKLNYFKIDYLINILFSSQVGNNKISCYTTLYFVS